MTKPTARLSAVKLKTAKPGKLQDGGGLILDKTEDGGKWLWRYRFAGASREMGLGSYPLVTLAEARRLRDKWALVLTDGKDPISERRRQIEAEKAAMAKTDPTLEEVAVMAFDGLKATLKGEGERGRWYSPLRVHVMPKIGKRKLSSLHQSDLAEALRPIWRKKHPTAQKAIQRLGIVFRWAKLAGYDCDPFTVDAAAHILGEVQHEPQGIEATPWRAMPALYAKLGGDLTSRRALRFMVLTCARADSVRGARFSEIEGNVWTVPGERMKSGKAFRYPLSPQALEIVAEAREGAVDDFLFPSYRRGACITETALLKALNTLGEAGRPHGFRSSFRTWVQDTRACDWDVAEMVLAHVVGGRVERTYARSDLLDERAAVMVRWADYVTAAPAVVVPLRA